MSTNFRFTTIFRKGTGTWWWMRACACMYAPACNQIWAKVIQGCRGPCLGALLCRDDATSDRACSTRLAAMEVAWTEPVWTQSHRYTLKHLLAVTQHCSRVIQPCGRVQPKNRSGFHREKGKSKLTKTYPVFMSTLVHTNPHCNTVLSSWINQRGVIWD